MNLNELREKKSKLATKALRESFKINLELSKLDLSKTNQMLGKIRSLISETKTSSKIHSSHKSPEYLKLLMMEAALSDHLSDLRSRTRIVVENEEVQKSQVILAAQDLIDSLQKMLEQVSKMNVEELPAVVEGITNEIGVSEGEQFNSSVGQSLNNLQQSLATTKTELANALGAITGQAAASMELPTGEPEEPVGAEELEAELPEIPELPEEPEEESEEESEATGTIGRERR